MCEEGEVPSHPARSGGMSAAYLGGNSSAQINIRDANMQLENEKETDSE